MASNPLNPAETDWLQVSGVLDRCAAAWCRHASLPDVFDGVDVKDVVAETWEAYFGSPTQLGWDPHEGPLHIFLWGVCRNKLVDHLRRHLRTSVSLDDDAVGLSRNLTSKEPSQHERLEAEDSARKFARELLTRIRRISDRPEELEAVVNAAMSIEEPERINQQLASLTNLPVTRVEIIKKRLRRLRATGEGLKWIAQKKNSESE
jgi:DNA-directed RNA polymerase specialized sigma24 family protein